MCYPHAVARAPDDLPLVAGPDGDRISPPGAPFLFRAVEAETKERGITGALIEEVRRRRGDVALQDPIFAESLTGEVNVSIWRYWDLDFINATLPSILDAFWLPESIVGDAGMTPNYVRWRKLFHHIYVEGVSAVGSPPRPGMPAPAPQPWTKGVVMPSAAGHDLYSIVAPRSLVLEGDHFAFEETATWPIPDSVIDHVLGDRARPDGWTAV